MASTSSGEGAANAAAPDPLVHVAFNQQGTHFVAATATAFHVFSCHTLERVMHRSGPTVASPGRTVSSAELLTRSQLAVVTHRPDDADVIDFWNGMCKEGKVYSVSATSKHGAVGGIRLQGEYMLVAGEREASLYFGGILDKDVTTGPNPLGLCAMSAGTDGDGTGSLVSYALPRKLEGEVRAHDSAVACIALSRDGRLLATAGTRGTLVRVFSTADGSKLQELRRGTDGATIHCMAFSPDSKWLAVTSDKTTVHVFRLGDFDLTTSSAPEDGYGDFVLLAESPDTTISSRAGESQQSVIPVVPERLPAELFQFRVVVRPVPASYGHQAPVAFDQQHPNTITIVGMDRSFCRCEFDPAKGGAMRELTYCKNFMDMN